MRRRALSFAALVAAGAPASASACPVCFATANDVVLRTYHLTALMMTVLPLLLLGGLVAWIHRRVRHRAA